MLMITLRDIQWRARRLVLGLLAAALVLAMTLLLEAVHQSFLSETNRAVGFFAADRWVVPNGISGPFTSNSPVRADLAQSVRRREGVRAVTPVAIFRHAVQGVGPGYRDVNVIAFPPDGRVRASIVAGRAARTDAEVVVDDSLPAPIGRVVTLAARRLTVVGTVHALTYNGGTPTVLVTLRTAQRIAFGGQPLASALVVSGVPRSLPAGLTAMTSTEVRDDLRRPLSVPTATLGLLSVLLLIVAAGIVGFVLYLSGLDRIRDFAVLKAVGVGSGRLTSGLVVQGVLVALLAAGLGSALSFAFAPVFPLPIEISVLSCAELLGIAVVIGILASIASVRKVVRVDPATAFA